MKTQYDKELITKLENEITEKIIHIYENTDDFIKEIEDNYPMSSSRIDWVTKKPLYFVDLSENEKIFLENSTKILLEISLIYPELINEKTIVIGDSLTELGYEVNFEHFIKLNNLFLSIPQHIYLWFPRIKKCINVTFENEIIFG